ncbi:hypothetical protein EDB85DRAFT_2274784 [Lactarius pseudohatsudake]|nr:hypothetical protein EDB85DRAFT_2274784 [Lactarius pseudohatsudake]
MRVLHCLRCPRRCCRPCPLWPRRVRCYSSHVIAHDASPANTALYRRGIDGFGSKHRSADELIGRDVEIGPPDNKRFTNELIGRDVEIGPPDNKRFTNELIGRDVEIGPPDNKRFTDKLFGRPESGFDSLDTAEREGKAKPGVNNKDLSEGSFFTDATLADRSIDEPRGTSSATFTRHHDPRRGEFGSFLGFLEADGALDGTYIIAQAHGSRSVVSQRVFINNASELKASVREQA